MIATLTFLYPGDPIAKLNIVQSNLPTTFTTFLFSEWGAHFKEGK